jgi:hypothetical protein
MPNATSGDYERSITRFVVHVCRPEGSDAPATVLHTLFRGQLEQRLAARFTGNGCSIVLDRSDDEAAWFTVTLAAPVVAIAASTQNAAAIASGVSVPGGTIRTFPGDLEVPVSEANDMPCATA